MLAELRTELPKSGAQHVMSAGAFSVDMEHHLRCAGYAAATQCHRWRLESRSRGRSRRCDRGDAARNERYSFRASSDRVRVLVDTMVIEAFVGAGRGVASIPLAHAPPLKSQSKIWIAGRSSIRSSDEHSSSSTECSRVTWRVARASCRTRKGPSLGDGVRMETAMIAC